MGKNVFALLLSINVIHNIIFTIDSVFLKVLDLTSNLLSSLEILPAFITPVGHIEQINISFVDRFMLESIPLSRVF
jgi:hypothetical protein